MKQSVSVFRIVCMVVPFIMFAACAKEELIVGKTGNSEKPQYRTLSEVPVGTKLELTRSKGLETASDAIIDSGADASFEIGGDHIKVTLPDGRIALVEEIEGGVLSGPIKESADTLVVTMSHENLGLQYSDYGTWEIVDPNDIVQSRAAWATGVQTQDRDMPTTGNAVYTGAAVGSGTAMMYNFNVEGQATLTADFAANTVNGKISEITVKAPDWPSSSPLADITLSAGTISGSTFAGSASGEKGGQSFDISDAKGSFGGKFYGPSAAEVAGSFSLSGGEGSAAVSIIGAFGAKK